MARQGRENRPEGEMDDRADQAVESGEPKETGRSHGKVIGADGAPAGEMPGETGKGNQPQHWESGRHQADQ
jgi:hypothetical protein